MVLEDICFVFARPYSFLPVQMTGGRVSTYGSHALASAVLAFICFDVALMTYVTPETSFLKTHTTYSFVFCV